MAVTHILWDNDGVLVDTEKLYFEACRLALLELDVVLTPELFAEYSLTRGLSVFDLAIERGALRREQAAAKRAARDELYAQLLQQSDCIVPGAPEVLARLSRSYTMGIVTSAKRQHFELTHRSGVLSRYMAFDHAREEYARSKPWPDPYLLALERQGLDARTCVAVEDSPRGVESACAAGLRCIAIPNPLAIGGRFEGALAVIARLDELPALLAGL